ncbi:MAG: hypothetical protein I3273_05030 [Candidatus Moeniiplasma glomeromycotorum]|nr:hypothetical protein [Candidatus Moeniiplasma glomeromycotorum]MCE8167906.1 hypothetical protein [Candidatus Moeniiplasma glomeromycotorum]MCE8169456.1 hypothetical protein [Candidatus Moeniiplasma glomeromycotorum]
MDYFKKEKPKPNEFFASKKENEKGEIMLSCINCRNIWTPNKHQIKIPIK